MKKNMRGDGKAGALRSAGDRAVSGCLTAVLVMLVCGIALAVMCAAPALGIALAIGGPAIAFRHQIGRNVAGVILILLGTVQLTVLAFTYERYASTYWRAGVVFGRKTQPVRHEGGDGAGFSCVCRGGDRSLRAAGVVRAPSETDRL